MAKNQDVPHRTRRTRGPAADVAVAARARPPASLQQRRHDAAMRTHARDAFKQCDMHEQYTGTAMVPSAARHSAAAPSTNARGIARAADSSGSQASTACSNRACCLSVGAPFQTRPPAYSGCVGRAGGARRCACCVAFRAAVVRRQKHRCACAFTIHHKFMLLETFSCDGRDADAAT
jgi:hypothetical protein